MTISRRHYRHVAALGSFRRAAVPSCVHRMKEDLHAICTRPASLLHPRELACCGTGPVALITPTRADIVEVESPQTGTPLPDSYQAAPPLR